ncbi:MAG: O-antigen ligase family protein [Alphaproteobacteria bacterium]
MIAVFSLLFLASSVLTNSEIVLQLILGCTLVATLSIIAYYVIPDYARMKEWHGNLHLPGKRMAGITGTANAVGYITAMCLMALYFYREYLPKRLPLRYWIFVALNLFALIMSNSRTSMVALIGAIIIGKIVKLSSQRLMIFFTAICLAIIFIATVDLDFVFSLIARSGEAEEIKTGTGRSKIWDTVFRLIGEKPIFGWGYGSSTFILPAESKVIGESVTSAHNSFLQVLLSVGFVGLFFFILVMGTKLYFSLKSKEPLNIGFISFLLINGMTESIAFQGVATTTTLVLAIVLALNYRTEDDETSDTAHQQRLPGSVAT